MLRNIISKVKEVSLNSFLRSQIYMSSPEPSTSEPLARIRCRNCSQASKENYLGVIYEPNFTDEEKQHLVNILNNSTADQLLSFNLSKSRIKKIETWKQKNGTFKNLTEVLDVDGLGVKMLHKLCMSIIEPKGADIKDKPLKPRGQILTPPLSEKKLNDLKSALGIHLYTTGLSWSKIERDNNFLTDWNYINYNNSAKKMNLTDTLEIAMKIAQVLPRSDVYIFEAPTSVTPTAQQSSISVTAYVQRMQFLSILMSVLSTSPQHNPVYANLKLEEDQQNIKMPNYEPNVYFLRQRLPARLFRTLVGSERVSAATTVSKIINNEKSDSYTPISLDAELNKIYNEEMPLNKEVLGQALLLTMTFMDVCVYQNFKSLQTVSATNR